jgi:hypothetical protein
VIAALVIGIVIAATRGDGGEAGSTTTLADQSTQPVQLADPTSATDGSASETAAGATTGAPERPPATVPAIVASDPVPRTTPDSSRPVATATIGGVGTDPVVVGTPAGTEAGATARPSDTEAPPTSDAPATTDAPGSSLPAEAGRLTLPPGTFVSPFTPAEPGRQQGVRDGSLEDFVDELLAANPRWTVDPPTNVGADTEQVELEMVGPQRTARVQLELGAPTSGRAITAFVITYDD